MSTEINLESPVLYFSNSNTEFLSASSLVSTRFKKAMELHKQSTPKEYTFGVGYASFLEDGSRKHPFVSLTYYYDMNTLYLLDVEYPRAVGVRTTAEEKIEYIITGLTALLMNKDVPFRGELPQTIRLSPKLIHNNDIVKLMESTLNIRIDKDLEGYDYILTDDILAFYIFTEIRTLLKETEYAIKAEDNQVFQIFNSTDGSVRGELTQSNPHCIGWVGINTGLILFELTTKGVTSNEYLLFLTKNGLLETLQ